MSGCSQRRGYTLIELLVSLASASVLMAGLASALFIVQAGFDGHAAAHSRNEADEALQLITADVRHALRFSERTTTALTFTVPDRSRDGLAETIRYAWEGDGGTLTRQYNDDPPQQLLSAVDGLTWQFTSRSIAAAPAGPSATARVQLLGVAEAAADSDTTRLTILVPGGTTTGNLLVAAVVTDGDTKNTLAAPAGWNLVTRDSRDGTVTLGVWWKQAGTADLVSHAFNWSGSEEAYGWIMRFHGHHATSPIHAWKADGNGDQTHTPTSPAVTTSVADTLIVRLAGFDDDDVTYGVPGLAGHTPITMNESSPGSGTVSGGGGYTTQAIAGSSGTSLFLLQDAEQTMAVTLAIAPAP